MNNAMLPSLERKFFTITKYFMMFTAILALLVAIGAAIFGLVNLNATADTAIQEPKPAYGTLKEQKAQRKHDVDNAKKAAVEPSPEAQEAPPQNPDNIPLEFMEQMTRIEISLKTFARNASQLEPSNNTRAKIYKRATAFGSLMPARDVLNILEAQTKNLEADTARIRNLAHDDPEYITWAEFLTFFYTAIADDLARQEREIAAAKLRADARRLLGMTSLYVAGGSFGGFIGLMIYLAILGIEKNSYLILGILQRHTETNG